MIWWLFYLVALGLVLLPFILGWWTFSAWFTFAVGLAIAFVAMAWVWLGWHMAKTEQEKMIWWLGVVGVILTLLAVLYSAGVRVGMGD